MQSMDVITSGAEEDLSQNEESFAALPPQNLDDDLDFNSILETAKKAKVKSQQVTQTLSPGELKALPSYIRDMVRYVKKYATSGKFKFEYDCSKLTPVCFMELATQFKEKYTSFFVVVDVKRQHIIVDWTGKNQV